jgi:hypothetical protein
MTRFGLIQNSPLETTIKTIVYRIYATFVTVNLSYFIFGIDSVILILGFAFADIIGGLTTYFTFENIWIWLNNFKPIAIATALASTPKPLVSPSPAVDTDVTDD